MTNRMAIVVATVHAGDNSRQVFGPFADGDAAARWGFKNFPNNTAPGGYSVTWCWEYVVAPDANVHDAIVSCID